VALCLFRHPWLQVKVAFDAPSRTPILLGAKLGRIMDGLHTTNTLERIADDMELIRAEHDLYPTSGTCGMYWNQPEFLDRVAHQLS
jgi:hypothetical protein